MIIYGNVVVIIIIVLGSYQINNLFIKLQNSYRFLLHGISVIQRNVLEVIFDQIFSDSFLLFL